MSRIGDTPINIPDKVEVSVDKSNNVTVKGPLGELSQKIDPSIEVREEENQIILSRTAEQKRIKSYHGMYRAILYNMVQGVTQGYQKQLELVGVGFRAESNGQILQLSLGFSHDIHVEIAPEVRVEAKTERRKNPVITFTSSDKQLVGQVAAKIRSLRPPEPYKGTGIKLADETILRKAGKAKG